MKVIVTGATSMVGEGVLLECLAAPDVERVLSVSRRPCGHTHPKLSECLVPDFRDLSGVEAALTGYDACFYCAGVSSVGLKEPEYTVITYDTALHVAEALVRLNPGMVLVHVSGAHTDGTEQGKVMLPTHPRALSAAQLSLPRHHSERRRPRDAPLRARQRAQDRARSQGHPRAREAVCCRLRRVRVWALATVMGAATIPGKSVLNAEQSHRARAARAA